MCRGGSPAHIAESAVRHPKVLPRRFAAQTQRQDQRAPIKIHQTSAGYSRFSEPTGQYPKILRLMHLAQAPEFNRRLLHWTLLPSMPRPFPSTTWDRRSPRHPLILSSCQLAKYLQISNHRHLVTKVAACRYCPARMNRPQSQSSEAVLAPGLTLPAGKNPREMEETEC
jgi:hypothetical protein